MPRKLRIVLLTAAISGCSSPPPPVAIEWDTAATPMNANIPAWQDNSTVITAAAATGKWSEYISSFHADDTFSPAIYYAVSHASRIVIYSGSGANFISARQWLTERGARGVIEFRHKSDCLTCDTTGIYFYR